MRPSFIREMVMMSLSGALRSEDDFGRSILSRSGGWNCVVVMKKMSSRKATSTMGVMSTETPMRLIFLSMASPSPRLALGRSARGEELDGFERRFVDHVVEAVHLGGEHVVGHD